jgi:hypothetical protein
LRFIKNVATRQGLEGFVYMNDHYLLLSSTTECCFSQPEPISKHDGASRNDCERNAAKPFLKDTRREYPHIKFIVIEDTLAFNAPS